MRQIFNKLAVNTAKLVTAAALALSVSFGALAQDNSDLPLPSFPASFEVAEYDGQKSCIPDDPQYQFAVMQNEGLVPAGMHPLLETTKTAPHIMNFLYSPDKGYGYTLSLKKDGMQCVYNKISNVRFSDELNNMFSTVSLKSPVTAQDCNFDIKAVNLCGSYEAVTGRLLKAGYQYNWQGSLDDQYKITLVSNDTQSFYLKTDTQTSATIITGVGRGAYKSYEVKKPNLIAGLRNQN
jgi:hypothetical protein